VIQRGASPPRDAVRPGTTRCFSRILYFETQTTLAGKQVRVTVPRKRDLWCSSAENGVCGGCLDAWVRCPCAGVTI